MKIHNTFHAASSLRLRCWAPALICVFAALTPAVQAATPDEVLAGYTAKTGTAPVPERGQKLDQVTEKPIAALAPAANPARFTDKGKVENWFRLNCKDFIGRECTAAEKADVTAWLISLKP
jgi:hypothetical protein